MVRKDVFLKAFSEKMRKGPIIEKKTCFQRFPTRF
jgi:hypothetical protein